MPRGTGHGQALQVRPARSRITRRRSPCPDACLLRKEVPSEARVRPPSRSATPRYGLRAQSGSGHRPAICQHWVDAASDPALATRGGLQEQPQLSRAFPDAQVSSSHPFELGFHGPAGRRRRPQGPAGPGRSAPPVSSVPATSARPTRQTRRLVGSSRARRSLAWLDASFGARGAPAAPGAGVDGRLPFVPLRTAPPEPAVRARAERGRI